VCVDATSGRGTRPHPHGFALTDGSGGLAWHGRICRVRVPRAGIGRIREVSSSSCVIVTATIRFFGAKTRGEESKGPVAFILYSPFLLASSFRPVGGTGNRSSRGDDMGIGVAKQLCFFSCVDDDGALLSTYVLQMLKLLLMHAPVLRFVSRCRYGRVG
jgi:hypothetical protein